LHVKAVIVNHGNQPGLFSDFVHLNKLVAIS
jgi:hypothetical protein